MPGKARDRPLWQAVFQELAQVRLKRDPDEQTQIRQKFRKEPRSKIWPKAGHDLRLAGFAMDIVRL
jgi:hypothetical protein